MNERHCFVRECVTAVYVNAKMLNCLMFLANASSVQKYDYNYRI